MPASNFLSTMPLATGSHIPISELHCIDFKTQMYPFENSIPPLHVATYLSASYIVSILKLNSSVALAVALNCQRGEHSHAVLKNISIITDCSPEQCCSR